MELFNQAIALENLEITRQRLKTLLNQEGSLMADTLTIEKERTRLRGDMERLKSEQLYLHNRVAFPPSTSL